MAMAVAVAVAEPVIYVDLSCECDRVHRLYINKVSFAIPLLCSVDVDPPPITLFSPGFQSWFMFLNGPASYHDCLPGITYVIARIERKREDIEAPPVTPDTSVLGGGDSAHPHSLLPGDATHSHAPPHPHCSKSLISLLGEVPTNSPSKYPGSPPGLKGIEIPSPVHRRPVRIFGANLTLRLSPPPRAHPADLMSCYVPRRGRTSRMVVSTPLAGEPLTEFEDNILLTGYAKYGSDWRQRQEKERG
ncbi:hypothetical protein V6N13_002741 [Hibiscus sabdariffa]